MALTKEQCKQILDKAILKNACSCNAIPAQEAYKKQDYETFEQICRGNYRWLVLCEILGKDLDIKQEGPAIEYGTFSKSTFHINSDGMIEGLKTTYWLDGTVQLRFFAEETLVIFAEYSPVTGECKINPTSKSNYVSSQIMQIALATIQAELAKLSNETHLGITP